jgi:hypothetical protein
MAGPRMLRLWTYEVAAMRADIPASPTSTIQQRKGGVYRNCCDFDGAV